MIPFGTMFVSIYFAIGITYAWVSRYRIRKDVLNNLPKSLIGKSYNNANPRVPSVPRILKPLSSPIYAYGGYHSVITSITEDELIWLRGHVYRKELGKHVLLWSLSALRFTLIRVIVRPVAATVRISKFVSRRIFDLRLDGDFLPERIVRLEKELSKSDG